MGTPRWIGDYELLEELGAGGMGTVYRARHRQTGAEYALKTLRAGADPEFLARFQREGEGQARVDDHPNVVRVHALGQDRGAAYLVMDLAPGGSLHDRLADGLPSPAVAAGWVRDLALAVEHAHRQGVLHRDLKPHNVLFTNSTPQLTDFGLAKLLDAGSLTETGTVLGTPAYMAPEQVTGDADAIGPATDVYGLGALLYRCLTGRPPFKGGSVLATMSQVLNTEPTPPRALRPEVSPALEAVCLDALAKDPALRPPSAQALALALEAALQAEPTSRRPQGPFVAALVGLALVAGAWAAATRAGGEVTAAPPPSPPPSPSPTPSSSPAPPSPSATPSPEPTAPPPLHVRRRGRRCPGPHHLDVRRAQEFRKLGVDGDHRLGFAEAEHLLRSVLLGAPCSCQAGALRELARNRTFVGFRDPARAKDLLLLAALSGGAQACSDLGLLWLPEEHTQGPSPLPLDMPKDGTRAAAAIWLAVHWANQDDQHRDDLPKFQSDLRRLGSVLPLPRSEAEALTALLGDDPVPPEPRPLPTPTGPDPRWTRASPEIRPQYEALNALRTSGGWTTKSREFRDMLRAILESRPSILHRTAFRELAEHDGRRDAERGVQLFARAALMGDPRGAKLLALCFAREPWLLAAASQRPVDGVAPDDAVARAALALASVEHASGWSTTAAALGRQAEADTGPLPTPAEGFRLLWERFPDAR